MRMPSDIRPLVGYAYEMGVDGVWTIPRNVCSDLPQQHRAGLPFERSLPTVGEVLLAAIQTVEPWSGEIAREVRRIAKSYVRQIQKLRRAAASGNRSQARSLSYWLTVAPASKICSVLLNPTGVRKSLTRIIEEAAEINPRKPTDETVRVKVVVNGDGKIRCINKFGPIASAKQTLVRDVRIARDGHSPFEFSRRGRGRDAVVRRTLRAINEGDVDYLVEADIKDFFPSVDGRALAKYLGIPASIVRNTVLISPASRIVTLDNINIFERMVRSGLPLGSRLSPFIASKLLEPVLAQVGGSIPRSFIDNIGLGTSSAEEAAEKIDTLAVLLRAHPVGPFNLKYGHVIKFGELNDVLGYLIRPDHFPTGKKARATPSIESILRAQRKLAAQLLNLPSDRYEEDIENWSQEWVKRYPVWRGQKNGSTNAFLGAYQNVIPHVRNFHRSWKKGYSSFSEMVKAMERFPGDLEPDPSYRPLSPWNRGLLSPPENTTSLLGLTN